MKKRLRLFAKNENGAVAVLTAICMLIIMGFIALGVDIGHMFVDRRNAQNATDLAALAAASDLANASKAAFATLSRNHYDDSASAQIELGGYVADPAVAASQRFQTKTTDANAVRVRLTSKTPLIFGRVLALGDNFEVQTVATATSSALAGFWIGSRLVQVDNGLANQILGQMLGANVAINVMDYRALADAKVDLFAFSNALAQQIRLSAVTYDKLLQTSVPAVDAVRALRDTTSGGGSALSPIIASMNSGDRILLSQLINLGPYAGLQIGDKPQVGATVAALSMLRAIAQIANGQHQVESALNLGIPGIASAKLKLAIGELPVGQSSITVDRAGASVHTAQTRLLLLLAVNAAAPLATLNVPVYIEVASATAKLTSIACTFPDATRSVAHLAVTPAVGDAWIGQVSDYEFYNQSVAPKPSAAALLQTPLLSVNARAHVTVTNTSPQDVAFTYDDIQNNRVKTVSTQNFTASLFSRLLSDTTISASGLGGFGLPGASGQQVATLLSQVATPLDSALYGLLSVLGVGLGQADVGINSLRCDGAVLVN